MNTDCNGAREYDLEAARSDIGAINSNLALQAANLASVTASLATLTAKFEVLSDDVTTLKVDVAVIKSNYATKADLLTLEVRMAKWFVATWLGMAGSTIATVGATFAIVKFFH